MNYSLKPPPLMAHVLPGLYFLLASAVFAWLKCVSPLSSDTLAFLQAQTKNASTALVYSVLGFFIAWLLGLAFDAIRNSLEAAIDRAASDDEGWWDIFFKGEKEQVEQLNAHYYSFYVFDANMLVASVVLMLLPLLTILSTFPELRWYPPALLSFVVLGLAALMFRADAASLRSEMVRLALEALGYDQLPHYKVYTRVRPSIVDEDGVGVFAISDIPKDTELFFGDHHDVMVWLPRQKVEREGQEIKSLYKDFCVVKSDLYGCPRNFNQMPMSWYVNETKDEAKKNVKVDKMTFTFSALREIKKGEELLADYSTYSQ